MSVRFARALAVLLLITSLAARAAVVPLPGKADARIREVDYREDQVVSLPAYVGYHIDLELEPGETFVALGVGDSAAVDVAAEGSHVLLKPKAAPLATNLTLVSSRRVYHFDYRTYEAQPSHGTAIFALRFRYGGAPSTVTPVATPSNLAPFTSVTPVASEPSAPPPATAVAMRPENRDYWYCGSADLRPVSASDDGVHTRLSFGSRGEWPAIFVRNADDSESLVNFHAEGTTAVVHRVAPKFVLRRGQLVGCVENRSYAGSGAYVESGTEESGLSREIRP